MEYTCAKIYGMHLRVLIHGGYRMKKTNNTLNITYSVYSTNTGYFNSDVVMRQSRIFHNPQNRKLKEESSRQSGASALKPKAPIKQII